MWLKVDPGQLHHHLLEQESRQDHARSQLHRRGIGAADDRPPKEDVVLKLFDYRFELDRALRKGEQVIRVETPGPTMHEVDIYPSPRRQQRGRPESLA